MLARPAGFGLASLVWVLAAASVASASGWSIQHTPNPPGATTASYLSGVSCTSARACTAAGYYQNSAGSRRTLVEHWNGHTWSIQHTPNTGGTNSQLDGVSCTSARACTVAGYYLNSHGAYVTLAERWNGHGWSIQHTLNPTGATYSYLNAVSCASAGACTATGYYQNSAGSKRTLVEHWNGHTWSIQHTPNPTGATDSELYGVSCTSANSCTAAGSSYPHSLEFRALAERWDGHAWSIQHTPNPGAAASFLYGVSCASARACTAVGYYDTSAGFVVGTLVERWNGHAWSIQHTPNTGSTFSHLSDVSCTSASACTAAGYYQNSHGAYVTLAERWNGHGWSIQHTLNPTGATASYLNGVSCTSAKVCTAAGNSSNSAGSTRTLAERWNG